MSSAPICFFCATCLLGAPPLPWYWVWSSSVLPGRPCIQTAQCCCRPALLSVFCCPAENSLLWVCQHSLRESQEDVPKGGIARVAGCAHVDLMRYRQAVSLICINLPIHTPFSSGGSFYEHLVLLDPLVFASLVDMGWYLIVVVIVSYEDAISPSSHGSASNHPCLPLHSK